LLTDRQPNEHGQKHLPPPLSEVISATSDTVYHVITTNKQDIMGHFTFWISLKLRLKFGLRPKISQKVKLFSLSNSLRPNFGLSDR